MTAVKKLRYLRPPTPDAGTTLRRTAAKPSVPFSQMSDQTQSEPSGVAVVAYLSLDLQGSQSAHADLPTWQPLAFRTPLPAFVVADVRRSLDKGRMQLALSVVFRAFDEWLLTGRYQYCDTSLQLVDEVCDQLPRPVLLGFLAASSVARSDLKNWQLLQNSVRERFRRDGLDPCAASNGLLTL